MAQLLSVEEAQKIILSQFTTLSEEWVALRESRGRVVSRDIQIERDMPDFTSSSMDGYAVIAGDTREASNSSPVRLVVIGDVPAGHMAKFQLSSGQAARIMTGAPLPSGADAVIPVENTDAQPGPEQDLPDKVNILAAVSPGAYLRPRGQDARRGQTVLETGHKLNPRDLGVLAALGKDSVPVFRKPKIALLSTGSELVTPGKDLQPGEVYDSNSYMLASQIEESGGMILELGIARDDAAEVRRLLEAAAAENCDLIITSAGVSVGAFDFVRQVIEENGKLSFWRVNMRPGKPLAFGSYRGIPLIGLPGNPVSAYVGMLVFITPAIRRMAGRSASLSLRRKALLAEPVESDGRESYLRAVAWHDQGQLRVKLSGNQSSGNLFSLIRANALLIIASGVKSLPTDSDVEIWQLTDEIE